MFQFLLFNIRPYWILLSINGVTWKPPLCSIVFGTWGFDIFSLNTSSFLLIIAVLKILFYFYVDLQYIFFYACKLPRCSWFSICESLCTDLSLLLSLVLIFPYLGLGYLEHYMTYLVILSLLLKSFCYRQIFFAYGCCLLKSKNRPCSFCAIAAGNICAFFDTLLAKVWVTELCSIPHDKCVTKIITVIYLVSSLTTYLFHF